MVNQNELNIEKYGDFPSIASFSMVTMATAVPITDSSWLCSLLFDNILQIASSNIRGIDVIPFFRIIMYFATRISHEIGFSSQYYWSIWLGRAVGSNTFRHLWPSIMERWCKCNLF